MVWVPFTCSLAGTEAITTTTAVAMALLIWSKQLLWVLLIIVDRFYKSFSISVSFLSILVAFKTDNKQISKSPLCLINLHP